MLEEHQVRKISIHPKLLQYMKDISGNRVPKSQKADAIAEYLHYK